MSNYGTFGENNPVWKAINRFADMMVTGLLFIITCIPVFTIGASLCAFYYTAMDSLRKEDGYIFKRYFTNFGKNFKKGTLLWLIMVVIGAICCTDLYFWLFVSDMKISGVMLGVSVIITLGWLLTMVFVFPLQARFENTVGKTLQNAFLIAISHLPFSCAVIILFGILLYFCCASWLVILLMLLFGNGVVGFLLVHNYERFFKKCGYIDEDDGKIINDDYDFNVEVDFEELHNQNAAADEEESEEDAEDLGADVEEFDADTEESEPDAEEPKEP